MGPSESLRKTGLSFLGDLPSGSHLCQFSHQVEDLIESVVPFIEAGLAAREYTLWLTPDHPSRESCLHILESHIKHLREYLDSGQLTVHSGKEWYMGWKGSFSPTRQIAKIAALIETATLEGWKQIRAAGSIPRLSSHKWRDILTYEGEAHRQLASQPALVLCIYPLRQCPTRHISQLIDRHHKTFLKKGARWELL